jgi:hypothetical protein
MVISFEFLISLHVGHVNIRTPVFNEQNLIYLSPINNQFNVIIQNYLRC